MKNQKPIERGSKKMISIQEAAEYLDVSLSTVRRWIREGRIKCYRINDGSTAIPVEQLVRKPAADDPMLRTRKPNISKKDR